MKSKKLIYLIFLLVLSAQMPCSAEQSAEEIHGRLFFTPLERAMLDEIRYCRMSGDESELQFQFVKLDGIIKRSSGKNTVWLNGIAHKEGEHPKGIVLPDKFLNSSDATLIFTRKNKSVSMKVGQTFDVADGTVREAYEAASTPPTPFGSDTAPQLLPETKALAANIGEKETIGAKHSLGN